MKLQSWNVNGLRAVLDKNFIEFMDAENPDILCLQETKLQIEQIPDKLTEYLKAKGYKSYWNCAIKKGYSGTAIFTKESPINVTYDIGIDEHDQEGRVITAEYNDFYLVTVYTPNSKSELERLDYRMIWEDEFRAYLLRLDAIKPVIICGDLNVAHKEIDLKNPKTNTRNAGFTIEERNKFTELIDAGFTDTFRHFYPDAEQMYSWWSYRFKAREKNTGWRIDYFVVSNRLTSKLETAKIHMDVFGSDHCPVEITL